MSPRRLWLSFGALACIAAGVMTAWQLNVTSRTRHGREHQFTMKRLPAFLTDEVALAMAREAMESEGLHLVEWRPLEDGRTVSPNGTRDRYFVRNQLYPNQGYIQFLKVDGKSDRIVSIELTSNRITCVVTFPK